MTKLYKVRIKGTGSFLPANRVTNHYISKLVDTSDEWIRTRSGIAERRWADESMANSDQCVAAAKQAMECAKVAPSEIDMVLVATVTPDYPIVATSAIVAHKLGMKHNPAGYEVVSACTGFCNATITAWHFLRVGTWKTALVIGSETLSRIVNLSDRTSNFIFGDGAGAVVLQAYEGEGAADILSCEMGQSGEQVCDLLIPAGGSVKPITHEAIENHEQFIHMNGRNIYKFAVRKMTELVEREMEKNGWTRDDVDLLVPHQVNMRIIESANEKLGLPLEKIVINIDRYANTSAASVPIALDEAVRTARLKRGMKVIMVAFGAGLTWSSLSLVY